jgi:3,4-dihydroxy 2-butanone 4-phosphate synthase/GTP cyclohydrolase II
LIDLGVKDMVLLSNTKAKKIVALEGYDLNIHGTRPVPIRSHRTETD